MTLDRKAARERCEKATCGPWIFDKENHGMSFDAGYGLYSEPDRESILARKTVAHVGTKQPEDCDFIAHCRQDLPAALDLLDEKDKELGQLRADLAAAKEPKP